MNYLHCNFKLRHMEGLQVLSRLMSHHGTGRKPCPCCDEDFLSVSVCPCTIQCCDGILRWRLGGILRWRLGGIL